MTTGDDIGISIEAKFSQQLASNEKKIRDRAFKKVCIYMTNKSVCPDGGFKRDEVLKIWKGLFYCMWMSDKPLVQEELARKMAELILKFSNKKMSMLYFEVFLATMQREWRGIDRLRMDKYYLLVRFMIRNMFEYVKTTNWNEGTIDWLLGILRNGPLSYVCPNGSVSTGAPLGLRYHVTEVYLEELTGCGYDSLPSDMVTKFILPYCTILCKTKIEDFSVKVIEKIFQEVIDNSEPALKVVAELEDSVVLPSKRLKYDYKALADALFECAQRSDTLSRNRKKVYDVVKKLRELAAGKLALDDFPDIVMDADDEDRQKVAEEELVSELAADEEEARKNRVMEKKMFKKRKRSDDAIELEVDELEKKTPSEENVDDDDDDDMVLMGSKLTEAEREMRIGGSLACDLTESPARKRTRHDALESTSDNDVGQRKPEVASSSDDIQLSEPEVTSTSDDVQLKTPEVATSADGVQLSEPEVTSTSDDAKLPEPEVMTHPDGVQPSEPDVMSRDDETDRQTVQITSSESEVSPPEQSLEVAKPRTNVPVPNDAEPDFRAVGDDGEARAATQAETARCVALMRRAVRRDRARKRIIRKRVLLEKLKEEDGEPGAIAKEEEFASFVRQATPTTPSFLRVAVAKVQRDGKRKQDGGEEKRKPVVGYRASTNKRVSFEMSKIQVQPFRKMAPSSSVGPKDHVVVPFDPCKTPDFSLLKKRKKEVDFFSQRERKDA